MLPAFRILEHKEKPAMSALTDFYFTEKLIEYGRKKTHSDIDDVAMEYCINSGFLDQCGQATEAGKNLMQFIHQSLLVPNEAVEQI